MESKQVFVWRRCRPAAGVPVLLAGLTAAVLTVFAQAPAWWTSRSVLATNAAPRDFAPINQGQLKWLAKQAAAEFGDNGLASTDLVAWVASFSPTNNYFTVNLGQLKNVARPFYDFLWANALTNCYPLGAGQPYPWSGSTNPVNNNALANIGQAKYLFSFDLSAARYSTLNDGLPDWWKIKNGLPVNTPVDTVAADGRTLWQHFHDGTPPGGLWQGDLITIPNAWAVYTNTTQVAVVADIRAANPFITIQAAEFFLDTTNGVTFGTGPALSALDGAFNATNEMAQALFTPAFPVGERHVFYIHAQGSDNRWCPFVTAILNPNIDDILNKIQANYSAIHDLQFKVIFTETKDGIVTRSDIVDVKMQGPYKTRSEYSTGLCVIQNENSECWSLPAMGSSKMQTGYDDSFDPNANRNADIFWDIPLWRARMTSSIAGNPMPGIYDVSFAPTAGSIWQQQTMRVDFMHGFVAQMGFGDTGISASINYLNPMEVSPGVWIFTGHKHVLQYNCGFELITESILADIKINQGFNDSLFNIPAE